MYQNRDRCLESEVVGSGGWGLGFWGIMGFVMHILRGHDPTDLSGVCLAREP